MNLRPFLDRVTEGDCLEVMRELPDACVDMVLCDLPYGTTANPWDEVIPFGQLWAAYERVVKPNGAIVLTGSGLFIGQLIMSRPDWYRYKMVWIKSKAPNFLQVNRQPLKKHEDILVFYRKQPVYHPQRWQAKPYDRGLRAPGKTGCYGNYRPAYLKSDGARYPVDTLFFEETDWVYFKTAESEGKVAHPSQKPVELGRYLIRMYTDPGAVILDNACGSGSFPVAAIREGRHFIAIERNQHMFYLKDAAIDMIAYCSARFEAEFQLFKTNKTS